MSIRIVSIGDYMTGENVHHFRRGIPTRFKGKFESLISTKARRVLQDGDILFLNFESALAHADALANLPIYKAAYIAPLESLTLLKSLKIPVVVNIANNHYSQHGIDVTKYTDKMLHESGFVIVGKTNAPVKIVMKEYLLNIWGVSLVNDKHENGSYFRSTYEDLIDDLHLDRVSKKRPNEYRIISIHWGNEYHTIPSTIQQETARLLAKHDFDLILGHHPHTIQPIEKIDNTWVVYSHGNFIFDQNFSTLTQKGLVTKFTFPEKTHELFLSKQKHFKVVDITETDEAYLRKFCQVNFSIRKPLIMRIKMKLELIIHFYELNIPIVKTFGRRLLKTSKV